MIYGAISTDKSSDSTYDITFFADNSTHVGVGNFEGKNTS